MARAIRFLPITSLLLLPLLGCSDPIPLPAEGAWALTFLSTPTQGKTCGITTHNQGIGVISPTQLDQAGLRKNLVDGSDINCQVIPQGTGFSAGGSNTLGGLMLSVQVPEIDGNATETAPVPGQLSYRSPETQNVFSAPNDVPCSFWFGNGQQQIAPGRVWMQFECDAVQHLSTDSSCAIGSGVVAFQNCES